MHKVLHPRNYIDWLYVPRKEVGRKLATNENSLVASIRGLDDYIKKNLERLILAVYNGTDNIRIKRTKEKKKRKKCEEKQLHEYFERQIGE